MMVFCIALLCLLMICRVNGWQATCDLCECDEQNDLKRADCRNKDLISIPSLPSQTEYIYLSNNRIELLRKNEFNLFENLIGIDLQHNLLTTLSNDVFTNTSYLRELDLRHNKLTKLLSYLFTNMKYLRKVELSHNNIYEIEDNCFTNVPKLNYLNLAYNNLSYLSMNFMEDTSSLKSLNLEDNPWHCGDAMCELMGLVSYRQPWRTWVPRCATPEVVQGHSWWAASRDLWGEGHCPHKSESPKESVYFKKLMHMRSQAMSSGVRRGVLMMFYTMFPSRDIDRSTHVEDTLCEKYRDECSNLDCPYGPEQYMDENVCYRCRCLDPCNDIKCSENTTCVVNPNPDKYNSSKKFYIGACRTQVKGGVCPENSGESKCVNECRIDVDCDGEMKCCPSKCGGACFLPRTADHLSTTSTPIYTVDSPAVTMEENKSLKLGDYVMLNCGTQIEPNAITIWKKDDAVINLPAPRHRMLSNGSLQIIGLYKEDAGIYKCASNNGDDDQTEKYIRLNITESTPFSANILGEANRMEHVVLGTPFTLHCFAYGWPRPSVVWWRGDTLVPLSNDKFAQNKDYSLLIRSATQFELGEYTCQAYNGLGKAATWTVTLQAKPENCTDNLFFANCLLIVQARYCQYKYYKSYCCKSCTEAGQISVTY